MITEMDLQEAIAECQGQRNPDSSTCIKLAAFYIIKENMYPDKKETPQNSKEHVTEAYSYSSGAGEEKIGNFGDSEFAVAISGKSPAEIWPVIVELMEVIETINPRLYAGVMRKIYA